MRARNFARRRLWPNLELIHSSGRNSKGFTDSATCGRRQTFGCKWDPRPSLPWQRSKFIPAFFVQQRFR